MAYFVISATLVRFTSSTRCQVASSICFDATAADTDADVVHEYVQMAVALERRSDDALAILCT